MSRIPPQYVVIAATKGLGPFIVYMGKPGDSYNEVSDRGYHLIADDRVLSEEFKQTVLLSMQVLSVSVARRTFSEIMRKYDQSFEGMKAQHGSTEE